MRRRGLVRGITIIEVLLAVVISSIALCALSVPFVAERSFWTVGRRQTEAQRDAHLVMRTISRSARESGGVAVDEDGAGARFYRDPDRTVCQVYFRGEPGTSGRFDRYEECGEEPTAVLEGESRVTALTFKSLSGNLVRVRLVVTRQGQEDECFETDLWLRNTG